MGRGAWRKPGDARVIAHQFAPKNLHESQKPNDVIEFPRTQWKSASSQHQSNQIVSNKPTVVVVDNSGLAG